MSAAPFKRVPFKRRPDRRGAGGAPAADRRRTRDRRAAGLGWLALFRGSVESAVVEGIISECDVLLLPAGALLLRPGEPNDNVYLLLSGEMAAYLDSTLPPEAAIPIHPGESVGELSAIDGKPVSALVIALTEARVLALPRDLFWNRLNSIPGIARNLLASLAERMRRSNEIMLDAQRKQLALEYLRQELEVARQLQAGMLPLRRPLFPERHDIEIAGLMEPASAVGGDLFDAFFLDERHLFFCIGDVSGHGVPAALFMARTIGLLRIAAVGTRRPERLLQRINDQLCAGNDANMFVTLFCGFLDLPTGRLVYSSGGHCAPLVLQHGEASLLPIPQGTLVGAIPGLRYAAKEIVLDPGVALLCFTDGVTEAHTEAGEEFSEERLRQIAATNSEASLEALLDIVRHEVAAFTGNRALADDCTLLVVRRPLTG